MKYFAIIFLIGFFWITRDIIRVPETFNDSFFKQFAGNQYIDPQVSSVNQYILGNIFSPVVSTVSDLFHILGTIILGLFFWMLLKAFNQKWQFNQSDIINFILMFIIFGTGNFLGWGLWRQLLNF